MVIASSLILTIILGAGALYWYRLNRVGLDANDIHGSMEFDGLRRSYVIHIPDPYRTGPVPLLLAFHGGGGNGAGMARLTHLSRIANDYGFFVVYPDGYMRRWADGRGVTPSERAGVDDIGFVSALINELLNQYRIDPTRVYVTGMSNGGFFSFRLACELPSKIAAIASIAATMPQNLSDHCHPQRPMSVLLLHGTDDQIVPTSGGVVSGREGGRILSLDATVNFWIQADACSLTPNVAYLPDAVNDGTQIKTETFQRCKDGSAVVLYVIEGGGHTWPGGVQIRPRAIVGKTSYNIDTGRVIWSFFKTISQNHST